MSRLLSTTLCALLLTGVTGFSAGCGENRSNLLPGNTVAEINTNLDQVSELYTSGDCIGAISTADEIKTQVLGLPPKVDQKLKKNLDDGINELIVKIRSACTETVTGETATVTPDEPDVTPSGSTGTTGTTETEPDPSTGTDTGNDKGNGKDQGKKQETKPTPTPKPEPTTPEPTPPDPVTPPTTPPDTGGVGPGT